MKLLQDALIAGGGAMVHKYLTRNDLPSDVAAIINSFPLEDRRKMLILRGVVAEAVKEIQADRRRWFPSGTPRAYRIIRKAIKEMQAIIVRRVPELTEPIIMDWLE